MGHGPNEPVIVAVDTTARVEYKPGDPRLGVEAAKLRLRELGERKPQRAAGGLCGGGAAGGLVNQYWPAVVAGALASGFLLAKFRGGRKVLAGALMWRVLASRVLPIVLKIAARKFMDSKSGKVRRPPGVRVASNGVSSRASNDGHATRSAVFGAG
ncbi:MAG: hypothetical protein H7Y88_10605 [Phycisphaerales bacterium]|nr:hypothetical protein [Phycisphaerales bacterium]